MSDVGAGRVGRRNSAGFVIASETFPVLCYSVYVIQGRRSQLKPSTEDDVLFLHSNLKHQAKQHSVIRRRSI